MIGDDCNAAFLFGLLIGIGITWLLLRRKHEES